MGKIINKEVIVSVFYNNGVAFRLSKKDYDDIKNERSILFNPGDKIKIILEELIGAINNENNKVN